MRVAVVGAGPAGAYAAYLANQFGHSVTVYERAAHPGGRTYSHRKDGVILDTGAAFITSYYRRLLELAPKLGIRENFIKVRQPNALSLDGEIYELALNSVRSLAKFPLLKALDKLRLGKWVAGNLMSENKYDLSDPASLAPIDEESAEAFGLRTLGQRNTEIILRSSIEPFWFFGANECSVALIKALSSNALRTRLYLIDGGIDLIVSRLLDGVDVQLSTPVDRVRMNGAGAEVRVGSQTKQYDRVIIATTASVARKLIDDDQRQMFPDALMDIIDHQKYAANIHIAYRLSGPTPVPGIRAVFPCDSGERSLGSVSFSRASAANQKPGSEELISVSTTDAQGRAIMPLEDDELASIVWGFARDLIPDLPASAKPFHITRWHEAIPMQAPGQYRKAAAALEAQKRARMPVRFCGDYFTLPWIEGALSSAEFALPDL